MEKASRKHYRDYQRDYHRELRQKQPARYAAYKRNRAQKLAQIQPVLEQENEWLYLCRSRLGLTQAKIAEMAGVCPSLVSRWERGTAHMLPRHKTILARTLREQYDLDEEVKACGTIQAALRRADL